MTYKEILLFAKQGKLIMLPHFEGIFKWDYSKQRLIFKNKEFQCNSTDLDILNRNDFYYII